MDRPLSVIEPITPDERWMSGTRVDWRLNDARESVRRGWESLDGSARAASIGLGALCALPAASNYSPGALGYGAIAVLLVTACHVWWDRASVPQGWRSLEVCVAALGAWALVSTLWGSGDPVLRVLPVALAVLCALAPWLLLRRTTSVRLATLGYACGAGTVGSLVAALPMTWLHHPRLVVIRPGLPIGGASNSAVGLTLLAAGVLMMARIDRRGRPIWLLLALADLAMIAQSVSRAGWFMAVAFVVVALVRWGRSKRLGLAVLAASCIVVTALQFQLRGGSVFGDSIRTQAAGNALQAWVATPRSVLVGRGAGSVWPWMDEEVAWRGHSLPETYVRAGDTGDLLYHAHSTYLAVLVEAGAIGFVVLLVALWVVCAASVRCVRAGGPLALVAIAVLLSVPAMLTDLYLLRSFVSSTVWWLAVWVVHVEMRSHGPRGPSRRAG